MIGNEPSVRIEVLEKLNGDEMGTFCANQIHLVYDKMKFRPDFVVSADNLMIRDFGTDIIENNRNKVLFGEIWPKKHSGALSVKLINGRPFIFNGNILRGIMSGGGSLTFALQIGYFMGIRKFYLYGVDHNIKYTLINKTKSIAVGDKNHFIENYRKGKHWNAPQTELIEQAFKESDKILRQNGGFLINATDGGNLNILERDNIMSVIESIIKDKNE